MKKQKRRGYWGVTATGRVFWPIDPRPEDIHLEDIVCSLARICRYNGHLRRDWPADIYSVGQHSLLVWREVRRRGRSLHAQKQALLHDAAEAYCHDIIQPMKASVPEFKQIEDAWCRALTERFAVDLLNIPEDVQEVDLRISLDEKSQVCSSKSPNWPLEDYRVKLGIQIEPMRVHDVMHDLEEALRIMGIE